MGQILPISAMLHYVSGEPKGLELLLNTRVPTHMGKNPIKGLQGAVT